MTHAHDAAVHLHAGEVQTLPPQQGAHLRVLSGRVWVTQSHELTDHFLDAGQSLRLRPHAVVVVGAEQEARLAIGTGQGRLSRLWHRWLQRQRSRPRHLPHVAPATVAG